MGIKPKQGNFWNLQSNAILERIYQVLSDSLRVYNLDNIDIDEDNNDPFDENLAAVSCAIIWSFITKRMDFLHPAQLVFGRDMNINLQPKIDEMQFENKNRSE